MKPSHIAVTTFLLSASVAVAGDFRIEEESLSPIAGGADAAIRKVETKQQSWLKDCKFIGRPIDLAGNGSSNHLVVTTQNACGWGAALGPIWVLRNDGGAYSVILSHGGYSLKPVEPKQNGLLNITISAGTAGWYQESLWSFDGTRYTKIKDRTDVPR